MAATPIGSVKKSTKQNSIESTEFFLDHCRLLVATGHFKLLEDTRYQSKWSIVTDISTVNSITLKQYEDDPNARWEKNVKLENIKTNLIRLLVKTVIMVNTKMKLGKIFVMEHIVLLLGHIY